MREMPLPETPFVIEGGCNCHAIRYRIQVPEVSARPLNPTSPASESIRLPMIAIDHCNDCRAATGSILPTWMCVPAEMMAVSLRPAPPVDPSNPRIFLIDNDGPWIPALEALKDGSSVARGSTVRWFHSSPKRTRTFCGHCGTNLTYAIWPMVQGYPDIFDTLVGTMDRSCLEKDWMEPERQCWWDKGIEWVQALSFNGSKAPRHPSSRVGESV